MLDSLHDGQKDIHADFFNGKRLIKVTSYNVFNYFILFIDFEDLFDEDLD